MSTAEGLVEVLEEEATRRTRMSVWWRFRRHRLALFGFIVLGTFGLVAIFAPIVAVQDPFFVDLKNYKQGPSLSHILGTDEAGRDGWARLVFAARVSLAVGIVAAAISSGIGTLIGIVSGYAGSIIDTI